MQSWKRSDGVLHNLTSSMHQSLVLMILGFPDPGPLLSNPSFCTDDYHDGDGYTHQVLVDGDMLMFCTDELNNKKEKFTCYNQSDATDRGYKPIGQILTTTSVGVHWFPIVNISLTVLYHDQIRISFLNTQLHHDWPVVVYSV